MAFVRKRSLASSGEHSSDRGARSGAGASTPAPLTSIPGARHLFLCDNMSMVLALSKGRGSTSNVNRTCQEVLALSLFANVHCCFRWIASEINPADRPSRALPSRPEPKDPRDDPRSAWGRDADPAEGRFDRVLEGEIDAHLIRQPGGAEAAGLCGLGDTWLDEPAPAAERQRSPGGLPDWPPERTWGLENCPAAGPGTRRTSPRIGGRRPLASRQQLLQQLWRGGAGGRRFGRRSDRRRRRGRGRG